MPVKTITNAAGNTFLFGRKRPETPPVVPRLRDYLLPAQLAVVPDCDYAAEAAEPLGKIYKNNTLGCCVISAVGHLFGVLRENAGDHHSSFSDGEIVNQYSRCCGYVPGDPSSDNGCFVDEVLADVQKDGFKGHRKQAGEKVKLSHRIVGYLAVDGTNKQEVRQAIYWFENVVIGLDLPDAWIEPFPDASGFTWDVAGPPDPELGHCVCGVGTNSTGIGISTWGMVGVMTYAAVAEYTASKHGGEMYVVLSEESINRAKGLSGSGLDWTQLENTFKAIGGSVAG